MKTLRGRLFVAVLAAIVVSVALTVAIGATLTRRTADRSTRVNLAHRADLLAAEEQQQPSYIAENYLADIDGSFYVTGYLRSWAFEAQLRDYLRSEFGNDWFARREAGELLRELWSLGQGPTADELLRDVTGATLEMAAVADRIREGLLR